MMHLVVSVRMLEGKKAQLKWLIGQVGFFFLHKMKKSWDKVALRLIDLVAELHPREPRF